MIKKDSLKLLLMEIKRAGKKTRKTGPLGCLATNKTSWLNIFLKIFSII